jgi:hypothetical protein
MFGADSSKKCFKWIQQLYDTSDDNNTLEMPAWVVDRILNTQAFVNHVFRVRWGVCDK